ncbi:hypothetical protein [Cylindrospermopsis raciborskii]|uniref:hypothetical protein n=1 Tax=Cylindrospermopsis raciborskii TaxID=77022 RepID=UPI003A907581
MHSLGAIALSDYPSIPSQGKNLNMGAGDLGTFPRILLKGKKGFCQKYRPQPKKVEKNRWGSKLLAGMKPNQKKKGTSPGQLKLFWMS